jgi:RecA-family ATPase
VILAALLLGKMFRLKSCLENPKIFWLDTEQQPSDVKQILTDVSKMTGLSGSEIDEHVNLYPLRSRTYKTLLRELKVNVNAHRPDVVFIDGVVEFVQSFNDEIMSHDLIKEQKILANDCNCAIINVLHENKSSDDENMRGHLGSMLSQAASTVIQCVKSNNGTITAKNSEARHAPMPDWSVRYDDDECIVDADEQARKEKLLKLMSQRERQQAEKEERERKRKDAAVQIVRNNGGSITRDELKQKLMAKLELGDSTVQEIIRMCLKSELCMVDGKVCLSPSESQNEPTA